MTTYGGNGGDGGGIWASQLTISNSTVSGNATGDGGSGDYYRYDEWAGFGGNGGDGGGIWASQLTISNSTVSGNATGDGGFGYDNGGAGGGGGGIWAGSTLSITGSTITGNATGGGRSGRYGNGGAGGAGGGIWAGSTLNITGSTITGNATGGGGSGYGYGGAGGAGGGIWAGSTLSITGSTITGNATGDGGSGLFNGGDGGDGGGIWASQLTISNSTVSSNATGDGGSGLFYGGDGGVGGGIWASQLTIINSTISGNSTARFGGGVFNVGGLTVIEHSTVTGNTAPAGNGSGVFSSYGDPAARIELSSSIVAGNANSDVDYDLAGGNTFVSNGYNLIGTGNALSAFNNHDQTNVTNPLLGPLADNGGPTMTHALLLGSPAIDAGDPAAVAGVNGVPAHDQRGEPFVRVYGGRIDMGAVEALPAGFLAGDYNGNGVVDAGDYTVWRNTLHSVTDLRADGNCDGVTDRLDYAVWKSNFGATSADVTVPVGGAFSVILEMRELQAGGGEGTAGQVRHGESATSTGTLVHLMAFGRTRTNPPADFGELSRVEPGTVLSFRVSDLRRDDALVAWLAAGANTERSDNDRDADALVSDLPTDEISATELDAWDAVFESLEAIGG